MKKKKLDMEEFYNILTSMDNVCSMLQLSPYLVICYDKHGEEITWFQVVDSDDCVAFHKESICNSVRELRNLVGTFINDHADSDIVYYPMVSPCISEGPYKYIKSAYLKIKCDGSKLDAELRIR